MNTQINLAARRTVRSNSVAARTRQALAEEMADQQRQDAQTQNQLEAMVTRRNVFEQAIHRVQETLNGANFANLDLVQLQDLLNLAETNYAKFENQHLIIVSEPGHAARAGENADVFMAVEQIMLHIRASIGRRLRELTPAPRETAPDANTDRALPPVHVELQTADALGNIPNTWGKFAGDYAEWHSFRDRFKAAVHDNKRLQTAFKFQYLKAAVTGAAERAMGNWNMIDVNYPAAWKRLCDVFEDDYLAIQTLIRKLLTIPTMTRPSYNALRRIIDTIHEAKTQLANFVDVTSWDPLLVFMAIDRLDQATLDAWETYRPTINEQSDPMDVDNADPTPAQQAQAARMTEIPSWSKLQAFLEQRARVLIHSNRREMAESSSGRNNNNQRNPSRSRSNQRSPSGPPPAKSTKQWTGYPLCKLCKDMNDRMRDHPVYRCKKFLAMDLQARERYVKENRLCIGCLKLNTDDHECGQAKCGFCPSQQAHNSLLCKTRIAALLTQREEAKASKGSNRKD